MRIINIVDSTSEMNYGIWHAAIVNSGLLANAGCAVELWFPGEMPKLPGTVTPVRIDDTSMTTLKTLVAHRNLDPLTDVIVTHGVWNYPSRWGHELKQLGFRWVYVPQGMLEPWPLLQKWLKKKIYFKLIEQRMAKNADVIRAVAKPEMINLRKFFPASDIQFIPNGVEVGTKTISEPNDITRFLFLSRLHHKKNIVSLVEAWLGSKLNNNHNYELNIIGPDQGELHKVNALINSTQNVHYRGVIFGSEKSNYFKSSMFYVLPSFSEGLPSALLEAMGNGLIPIITDGCNLPDVFDEALGLQISTNKESIRTTLELAGNMPGSERTALSEKNREYIRKHFSVESITRLQLQHYLGKADTGSLP